MNNLKISFASFFIIICFVSLNSQQIQDSKLLSKYYNVKEINVLEKFVHDYDSAIFYYTSNKTRNDFFSVLYSFYSDIENDIPADSSLHFKEFNSLLKNYKEKRLIVLKDIDSSLYNDIFCKYTNYMNKRDIDTKTYNRIDTIYTLGINPKGSYFGFFEKYSKNKKFLKDYRNIYFKHGDFSPNISSGGIKYFSKLDLNNELICFITIIQIDIWLVDLVRIYNF